MFWKRIKRGLKKAGNVVAKYTGVTYVANKTGLSKQVNKKRCRAERERARRDQDNEKTYLDNTNTVNNMINSAKNNINNTLKPKSLDLQENIEKKNTDVLNTVFNLQNDDAISSVLLDQIETTYDGKVDQVEELL